MPKCVHSTQTRRMSSSDVNVSNIPKESFRGETYVKGYFHCLKCQEENLIQPCEACEHFKSRQIKY